MDYHTDHDEKQADSSSHSEKSIPRLDSPSRTRIEQSRKTKRRNAEKSFVRGQSKRNVKKKKEKTAQNSSKQLINGENHQEHESRNLQ